MRVLIGCERSGVIRDAFLRHGHDAYSCDLVESETPGPHIVCDVLEAMHFGWDLFIVHPDCRFLSNSGVLRLYLGGKKSNGRDEARWEEMRKAAEFFRNVLYAPVPRVCVENPVMHGHARKIIGVRPRQSIQPWQFGDDASKRTCLWLVGLDPLVATNVLRKQRYANQTPSGQNKLGPSPDRHIRRARSYPGIADAMAAQWGRAALAELRGR